jgi:hypothetical protein
MVRKGHPLREPDDTSRLEGFGPGWPRLRHKHEQAGQVSVSRCGQVPSATRVLPRRVGASLLGVGFDGPRVPVLQPAVTRAAWAGEAAYESGPPFLLGPALGSKGTRFPESVFQFSGCWFSEVRISDLGSHLGSRPGGAGRHAAEGISDRVLSRYSPTGLSAPATLRRP